MVDQDPGTEPDIEKPFEAGKALNKMRPHLWMPGKYPNPTRVMGNRHRHRILLDHANFNII